MYLLLKDRKRKVIVLLNVEFQQQRHKLQQNYFERRGKDRGENVIVIGIVQVKNVLMSGQERKI